MNIDTLKILSRLIILTNIIFRGTFKILFSIISRAVPRHMNANVMNKTIRLVCVHLGEKLVKKLKELEEDLNNQECARVGSAHWLPPPTRHSMQDISIAATNRPSLDHTQSMPNLEVRIVLNIMFFGNTRFSDQS